eukprot:COSAG01_NODE_37163_length_507_cov_2.892157_1_plen_132_part_00
MRRPWRLFVATLAEIYLRGVCSCQEILRRNVRVQELQRKAAATRIQAAARGRRARYRQVAMPAATWIQSHWRRHTVRQSFLKQKRAITYAIARVRGFCVRLRMEMLREGEPGVSTSCARSTVTEIHLCHPR